jgi:hypothetical protein
MRTKGREVCFPLVIHFFYLSSFVYFIPELSRSCSFPFVWTLPSSGRLSWRVLWLVSIDSGLYGLSWRLQRNLLVQWLTPYGPCHHNALQWYRCPMCNISVAFPYEVSYPARKEQRYVKIHSLVTRMVSSEAQIMQLMLYFNNITASTVYAYSQLVCK